MTARDVNPHGVSTLMRELKALCTAESPRPARQESLSGALRRHLEGFEGKLSLVLEEHEGMANELLQAFEQLGIVFEVTRRLASVKEEGQALRLFVESLRPMFPNCNVFTVGTEGSRDRGIEGEVVAECRREGRVVVKEVEPEVRRQGSEPRNQTSVSPLVPQSLGPSVPVQVMAGPIHAGEEYAGAVVVVRGAEARKFNSADMLLIDSLSAFCGDIIRNLRLVHELRQLSIDMIRGLVSAIDQKDGYTSGHSNRVAVYARMLAEALGWPDERLQMLEWSALLHDVGKIGIRDAVLKKSGKLTPDEFEHMKEHPVRSYEVVKKIPQLAEAIDGVLHHHERYDGKGYPAGLAGEAIPLQARVIQIADIFDALTSSRSYRAAFSWEKALAILREESGVVVDPGLAALFEKLIRGWAERDPHGFAAMFNEGPRDRGTEGPKGTEGEGPRDRGTEGPRGTGTEGSREGGNGTRGDGP